MADAGIGDDDRLCAAWIEGAVRLEADGGDGAPGAILAAGRAAMADLIEARRDFEAITGAATDWAGSDAGDGWLEAAGSVGAGVATDVDGDRLRDWCAWLAACATARDAGIWPVVEALVAGAIAPKQARELTRVAHARGWVNAVIQADPVLASFRGLSHRQQVDRFRELDARLTAAATVETRERLARAVPRKGDVGDHPQWLTLSKQIQMQRRQMPVRRLIEELPDVVRVLAPCLMMSPISIAQYLPARHAIFDVVIFDEASQLPTWDAVGAIARGRPHRVPQPDRCWRTGSLGRIDAPAGVPSSPTLGCAEEELVMRLGIWCPAPLSMRPDAKAQPAIDGLTRHGGGVDKNYLYAVDTLQREIGRAHV